MARFQIGLAVLLLLQATGSDTVPRAKHAPLSESLLVDGDVIFRAGTGMEADLVRTAEGGRQLSHVGLAFRVQGQWLILHTQPEGGLVAEPLSSYLAPERASGVAAYRQPSLSGSAQVRRMAFAMLKRRPAFDDGFDLTDPTSLYCTEFVWRALTEGGFEGQPQQTNLSLPFVHRKVMLPTDLISSAGLVEVAVPSD